MLLKFCGDKSGTFTHYYEIPNNEIKKYVGPINEWHQVSFKFALPIDPNLRPYFNNREEYEYELNVPYEFYYVEGGNIVVYYNGELFFHNQNITHFKVGNNDFQPIANISLYYSCWFNAVKKIFQPIGGIYMQYYFTTEKEIQEKGLQKMEF
jgi:hypothetical protein